MAPILVHMRILVVVAITIGVVIHVHAQDGAWDSYLDIMIDLSKDSEGTANIDQCAIIKLDDGSQLSADKYANDLKLVYPEGANIAQWFNRKYFIPFMIDGIRLEGVRYQFLRIENNKLVLGKKKGHGAVTMQSSRTAVIIAHVPEGGNQELANKAVGAVAKYLESINV